MFPVFEVHAPEEVAEWERRSELARLYGGDVPAKSRHVVLHCKRVEKLGEWSGSLPSPYRYTAIRPVGEKGYEIIPVGKLRAINGG